MRVGSAQKRVRRALWRGGYLCLMVACFSLACRTAPPDEIGDKAPQAVVEKATVTASEETEDGPSRIILFIGDGMGLSAVSAAGYAAGRELEMMQMPQFGLMTTHGYEFVTTDSAASATAMATGEKTHFQGVSVRPSAEEEKGEGTEHDLRTVAEAAGARGWKSGLVATVRMNHATPGPFAAHRHQRHQYEEIALDMSLSGVDVMLGPGSEYFSQRRDERNLFDEMAERGYEIALNADEIREASRSVGRLVGLLEARDMPWADSGEREIELAELVDHALSVLDRDEPEGFFLMVEGSMIDWAGHAFDGSRVVSETLDMDRAVGRALEYARNRSDTLVIVTSDHETGAMDVIDPPTAAPFLEKVGDEEAARLATTPDHIEDEHLQQLRGPFAHIELAAGDFGPSELTDRWLTTTFGYTSVASREFWDGRGRFSGMHTPLLVPIFAEGPGAREAAAVRDNADLGRQLMAWIEPDSSPELERVEELQRSVGEPKNVILLLANGLGIASLTAGYYHFGHLSTLEMPQRAAVSTHGLDRLVNDAAAATTALATGHRTRLGVLGMAPGGDDGRLQPRASVVEEAARRGRKTGLITTSSLMEAGVAAFYGRSENGSDHRELAGQLQGFADRLQRDYGIDFLVGADSEYLDDEIREEFEDQGYIVHSGWGAGTPEQPDLFLLGEEPPRLADITSEAITTLQNDEKGFFLLVESSRLGAAKRGLNREQELMQALKEFDEAVEAALEFADRDGETLVLVSADHDYTLSVIDNHYGFHRGFCGAAAKCGGDFQLHWLDVNSQAIRHGAGFSDAALQEEFRPPEIALQYTWMVEQAGGSGEDLIGPRSANFVPLFAAGPGETAFGGVLDQPEVGQWLIEWAAGE